MLLPAKALAEQSFQRVPFYRFLNLFSRYRKPEARAVARVFTDQYGNTGVAPTKIILKDLLKFNRAR